MKRILGAVFFLFFALQASTQDLTGTWESTIDNREFLQLNIVKGKGKMCGYTWDYEYSNRNSFCKAFFDATFDPLKKQWIFVGRYFIDKSIGHELMVLRLRYIKEDGEILLRGTVGIQMASIFGTRETFVDNVTLKRVSKKPTQVYKFMQDCIDELKKPSKKPSSNEPNKKPESDIKREPVVDMPPPQKKVEVNVPAPPTPPAVPKKEPVDVAKKMEQRKRTEVSRVQINTRDIELKVYDNGEVDNDTVSIYYNGRLIADKKRLSETAITIPLHLDEQTDIHEIVMYAENLGSIPPNTALIVVTAGKKRFELRSSATLDTNAVLVFEYKPEN